ncbi:MAG: hypothetical protein ACXV8Q_20260 [Methylobacter sp.]
MLAKREVSIYGWGSRRHKRSRSFCRLLGRDAHKSFRKNSDSRGDAAFKESWRSQLGSTLKPVDIVICDNLTAHKVADVQEVIEAIGATMKYLPAFMILT